jgi:hypothetical protein
MKELSKKTYTKTVTDYELHPDCDGVVLKVTRENGKIKDAILSGKRPEEHLEHCRPAFAKPALWQGIEKVNPWWEVEGRFLISKAFYEPKELLKLDLIDPVDLMWVYGSGHLLFDSDGRPIPLPTAYDYIDSPFTNVYCELIPLLEHLKAHPWVVNGDELHIDEVPYYNNESGKYCYIRGRELPWVVIRPDAESWMQIYQMSLEMRKEYFSVAMKELLVGGPAYAPVEGWDPLDIKQFRLKERPSWA